VSIRAAGQQRGLLRHVLRFAGRRYQGGMGGVNPFPPPHRSWLLILCVVFGVAWPLPTSTTSGVSDDDSQVV